MKLEFDIVSSILSRIQGVRDHCNVALDLLPLYRHDGDYHEAGVFSTNLASILDREAEEIRKLLGEE